MESFELPKSDVQDILSGPMHKRSGRRLAQCSPEDEYERGVVEAARYLVEDGKPECRYLTQYISGTTLWEGEDGTITVTKEAWL